MKRTAVFSRLDPVDGSEVERVHRIQSSRICARTSRRRRLRQEHSPTSTQPH